MIVIEVNLFFAGATGSLVDSVLVEIGSEDMCKRRSLMVWKLIQTAEHN